MTKLIKLINNQSITIKALMAVFLMASSSLVITLVSLVVLDKQTQKNDLINEISTLSSIIGNRSQAAIVFDAEDLANDNLEALKHQKNILAACIYTASDISAPSSHTLAKYPDSSVTCPTLQPSKISVLEPEHGEFIEFIDPITLDQAIIGYSYLRVSLQDFNNQIANNLKRFIAITLIALIIPLLLLRYGFKQLFSPLAHLSLTSNYIASNQDYSRRAEKVFADEIGEVVDAFNHMLETIETTHSTLCESEEKFRSISESSKIGIFQFNKQGELIFTNEEMGHIFQKDTSAFYGESWVTTVHPDEVETLKEQFNVLINKQTPMLINCQLNTEPPTWVNGQISPMYDHDNQVIGYLGTIKDITEIRNVQSQLEQMAFYDTLTGLANRRLFRNRLEHMLSNLNREKNSLGLILIDLDNFKDVNDSVGHDSGDILLSIIANRLKHNVRTTDTVARLGGDEFAIILPGISDEKSISLIVDKLIIEIQKPIILQENEYRIGASLGISMAPGDADGAEDLIKQADLALYRAKDSGRNNYQFFTAEMNQSLMTHLELVKDLRTALEEQQFYLVFQPQIDFNTHQISGFEALIRWICPKRGFVPPDKFIETAEDTGLILPIGRFVIEQACQQLRELIDKQLIAFNTVMTVNLSIKQFQDEGIIDFIQKQLKTYNLNPSQFEVELTETVLMENMDEAIIKLQQLQKLGILISIDDFGTGYSSLGYLKQLPVNIIKVDRSFVMDIPESRDDMEITAAVIAMAHSLNYKVVAEGVETEAQVQFLQNCNCDYGQGYHFSKPLEREDLLNFCNSHQQKTNTINYSL